MACPHLPQLRKGPVKKVVWEPDKWICSNSECNTSLRARICLCCGNCWCEKHMKAHAVEAKHPLSMEINSKAKAAHCERCGRTVSVDSKRGDLAEIRRWLEEIQSLTLETPRTRSKRAAALSLPYLSAEAMRRRRADDLLKTAVARWKHNLVLRYFNQLRNFRRGAGHPEGPLTRKDRLRRQASLLALTYTSTAPASSAPAPAPMDTRPDGADAPSLPPPLPRARLAPASASSSTAGSANGNANAGAGTGAEREEAAEPAKAPGLRRGRKRKAEEVERSQSENATAATEEGVGVDEEEAEFRPLKLRRSVSIRFAPGACGLRNLGNTCYMNSVLQAISNTPKLRSFLLRHVPLAEAKESDKDKGRELDPPILQPATLGKAPLTHHLVETLRNLWAGKRVVFTPDGMLQTVWRLCGQFRGFKQQDAQEFALFFLDQLRKEQGAVCAPGALATLPLTLLPHLPNATPRAPPPPAPAIAKAPPPPASAPAPASPTASAAVSPRGRRLIPKTKAQPKEEEQASEEGSGTESDGEGEGEGESESDGEDEGEGDSGSGSGSEDSGSDEDVSGDDSSSSSSDDDGDDEEEEEVLLTRRRGRGKPSLAELTPLKLERYPPLPHGDDFFAQHFGGRLRSQVSCDECGHASKVDTDLLGILNVAIPSPLAVATAAAHSEDAKAKANAPGTRHRASGGGACAGEAGAGGQAEADAEVEAPRTARVKRRRTAALRARPPSYTLQECLNQSFGVSERLEGSNSYSCAKCKRKVSAVKQSFISALPAQYLILHIVRTEFDPRTARPLKNTANVTFPLRGLDMAPYLPAEERQAGVDYVYDLYAAVEHHGRGMDEGHFTAVSYLREQDSWLLYNDARVSVISEADVAKTQAYLLFYERRAVGGGNL